MTNCCAVLEFGEETLSWVYHREHSQSFTKFHKVKEYFDLAGELRR